MQRDSLDHVTLVQDPVKRELNQTVNKQTLLSDFQEMIVAPSVLICWNADQHMLWQGMHWKSGCRRVALAVLLDVSSKQLRLVVFFLGIKWGMFPRRRLVRRRNRESSSNGKVAFR